MSGHENAKIITMEDGSIINFGTRAKLVTTVKVTDTGFTVLFNLISARVISYIYESDVPVPRLLLEMAAFGAASKAKAATSNATDEAGVVDILTTKLAEFQEGIFVSRGSTGITSVLNMTQQAYCEVEGLDSNLAEVITDVKMKFKGMSVQDKAVLSKTVPMRVAMGKIRLAQAQAELEAMELQELTDA